MWLNKHFEGFMTLAQNEVSNTFSSPGSTSNVNTVSQHQGLLWLNWDCRLNKCERLTSTDNKWIRTVVNLNCQRRNIMGQIRWTFVLLLTPVWRWFLRETACFLDLASIKDKEDWILFQDLNCRNYQCILSVFCQPFYTYRWFVSPSTGICSTRCMLMFWSLPYGTLISKLKNTAKMKSEKKIVIIYTVK